MASELIKKESVKSSELLASRLNLDPRQMVQTIKAQCFSGINPDRVTDEQLAAFIAVANEMQLNPLLPGMLYAYPKNGGIVPIIGPDGVFQKIYQNPDVTGVDIDLLVDDTKKPWACKAMITTKSKGIIRYTALFSDWVVPSNPNWKNRPGHMLQIRAIKQCARMVIHGMPMDEEERQIIDAEFTESTQETKSILDAKPITE
jgi:hypothetical protein